VFKTAALNHSATLPHNASDLAKPREGGKGCLRPRAAALPAKLCGNTIFRCRMNAFSAGRD
ncbi:MAG: hypothetical protein ABWY64_05500, partial [Tardiphaga sp.]